MSIAAKRLFSIGLLLFACAGCASHEMTAARGADSCAECLVCKKNADLACVDVKVDKDTPRYTFNDRTYFFCSEDCRSKFIANPTAYTK